MSCIFSISALIKKKAFNDVDKIDNTLLYECLKPAKFPLYFSCSLIPGFELDDFSAETFGNLKQKSWYYCFYKERDKWIQNHYLNR